MINAFSLLVIITHIFLSNSVEWSIAGDIFVYEGANANYNIALKGKLPADDDASVILNITNGESTPIDHEHFLSCVKNAVETYTGAGTVEYHRKSFTLTFYAISKGGDEFGGLPIIMTAKKDKALEEAEEYTIFLSRPKSTTGVTVTIGNKQIVTTILDKTPPTTSPTTSPNSPSYSTIIPRRPCGKGKGKGPPGPPGPPCLPLPPCGGKGKGSPPLDKGPLSPPRFLVDIGLQLDYPSVLNASQKSSETMKVHQVAIEHSCQPSNRVKIQKFIFKKKQRQSYKSSYDITIRYQTINAAIAHVIANKNTSTLVQQIAERTGASVMLISAPKILSLVESIGTKKNISLIIGLTALFTTIVFSILFIIYSFVVKPRKNAVKTALKRKEGEISLLHSTNQTITL